MLIIAGKTGSGKTFLVEELVKNHGFKKLVTYTTRPMRDGEAEGIDYHFVSKDEFEEKVKSHFFAEWQTYKMADDNTVYYGSAIEDYENATDKTVIILTPKGVEDITKSGVSNKFVIYLYANLMTIHNRLEKRGDDKDEIERRIKADIEDFRGFDMMANKIVYNNGSKDINEVCEVVKSYYEQRN